MMTMLLVVAVSIGNLVLGFALAVCLGQGPGWAARLVPRAVRERVGLAEHL
jgi:hypothetical protein